MDDTGKRIFDPSPTATDAASRDARTAGGPAMAREPSRGADQLERICRERDQLRMVLQMVLDVGVFDGAGRSVTVKTLLRGYLATRVRVALEAKREA
jgi:hypothetical protein